ncbi:LysR family transcriptional regulator, partial [Photobacterium sanctipauli]|uniref:LysR family transcriptional regulator n=1 Tax=Photobacterium sanctipauli TaxID=1342794 RepID=UPI00068A7F57
ITKLDLNLLKVLLVLLEEPNTHRAAEKLDTSQPSISRSLGKLRDALGDQLFVRSNRGLTLTPRAEELAAVLPHIFADLESTLDKKKFHPKDMNGKFRIALNGYLIESYGTEIYRLFNRECPDVELELYSFGSNTINELKDGYCDLAITYQPLETPKEVYQRNIAKSRFGFLCRRGFLPENKAIPIEELDNYRWAGLVVPGFNEQMVMVQKFAKLNKKPAFRSQHVNPVLNAIQEEDMLLIAPVDIYKIVDQALFQFIEMDESEQTVKRNEMEIVMAYSQRHWNTEKYQWLESEIKQLKAIAKVY